jgi:KamA family protein
VSKKLATYSSNNFQKIKQLEFLPEAEKFAIEVVSSVLPFRANNYVIEELIIWDNIPDDPIFRLVFPQKEMLSPEHFNTMATLLKTGAPKPQVQEAANQIRVSLNPHPAGQLEHNIPRVNGKPIKGIQHKYRETVLFFPGQGQTCHAYCTFCFRWPQFVGDDSLKIATRETGELIEYLRAHPEVTDVLFTGGDPMIMKAKVLAAYINPLLEAKLPNLHTIRIGSKSLAYWPYRYLTDNDAEETLQLFKKVKEHGLVLAFMAHFNHPQELETEAVKLATERILSTGAQIRTQSPIMKHINDSALAWSKMWRKQVDMGMIPYYMFIARDTGAQHYFAIPLVKCWEIFKEAYSSVSGVCRTVRGPSMSAKPGKVQILGTTEIKGEKAISMRFIQGRNAEWVHRPFFAKYDPHAIWLDELVPAFGEQRFFFQKFENQFIPIQKSNQLITTVN